MKVKYPFSTDYIDKQSLQNVHSSFSSRENKRNIQVTFMVPCLNEEDHILSVLKTLIVTMKECDLSYEIIVIDDNSADGTIKKIHYFKKRYPNFPIKVVRNTERRGVASNFFHGSKIGRGLYYRMVNGDNVEPFKTHLKIYKAIGSAELLIPDYHTILNRKLFRSIISKCFTMLVNKASGLHLDYYNGCPVYLREDICNHSVKTSGLGFSAEMITKLIMLGRSYHRIPLVGYDQEGSTALTVKNFVSVGYSLINIIRRRLNSN